MNPVCPPIVENSCPYTRVKVYLNTKPFLSLYQTEQSFVDLYILRLVFFFSYYINKNDFYFYLNYYTLQLHTCIIMYCIIFILGFGDWIAGRGSGEGQRFSSFFNIFQRTPFNFSQRRTSRTNIVYGHKYIQVFTYTNIFFYTVAGSLVIFS